MLNKKSQAAASVLLLNEVGSHWLPAGDILKYGVCSAIVSTVVLGTGTGYSSCNNRNRPSSQPSLPMVVAIT